MPRARELRAILYGHPEPYVRRSRRRAAAAAEIVAHQRGSIGTISVACALGYLDYRFAAMDWRAKHPKLAKWFNSTAKTPAMKATPPPAA